MNCVFTHLDDGRWECGECGYTTVSHRYTRPPRIECRPEFRAAYKASRESLDANLRTHVPVCLPGRELSIMLANYGLFPTEACLCDAKVRQMNEWGPAGCRENFNVIAGWLHEGYRAVVAANREPPSWLDGKLDPTIFIPILIDEAIRLAEKNGEPEQTDLASES